MNIVQLDLLDGHPMVVVVANEVDAARLRKFFVDAGDAFNDRDRWLKVRDLMTHERSGPNVGWTIGTLLPGDDPDSAIDASQSA